MKKNINQISNFLSKYPQFVNEFDLSKFNSTSISFLLREQPQLINNFNKFDLDKLNGDDILVIIKEQPTLPYDFKKA